MSPLDGFVLVVITLSALISLMRGAVYEVVSLAGWIGGVWASAHYAPVIAATYLSGIDNPQMRLLAAYAMCFVLVVLGAGMVATLLRLLLRVTGLGLLDRSLGAVIGLVKGVALCLLLIGLGGETALAQTDMWKAAILIPPAQAVLSELRPLFPSGLSDHLSPR